MTVTMEAKVKTIEKFKLHESDTGSADVQIALLTERINQLTEHLQKNYLHSTDVSRYQLITKKLKLRK